MQRTRWLWIGAAALLGAGPARGVSISGYVRHAGTGESLPFVNVYLQGQSRGTISNESGYYAIVNVPAGRYTLVSSLVGYRPFEQAVTVAGTNLVVAVVLAEQPIELATTVVQAKREEVTGYDISPGRTSLQIRELKTAPAAIEADPIRTIQTLPGVSTLSDFSVGLYVRGGTPDQTLVLLDGTDVYNASHLFGLFSTFPADAAKSTELLRGGYPARYGGRLSSVLNVITNEGNKEEFQAQGGLSFLASRLTLQGPAGRGSWLVSGRRTHLDPLIALARKALDADRFGYNFYDLQGKTHQVLSHSDQLTLAGYTGQDSFNYRWQDLDFDLAWGNRTVSARWTHLFSSDLFGDLLLTGSRFRATTAFQTEDVALEEYNRLTDLSLKADLSWFCSERHSVEAGVLAKRLSMQYVFGEAELDWANVEVGGYHHAAYLQDSWSLTPLLKVQPGLRLNYSTNGSYADLSPRLALRYQVGDDSFLKAAYGHYHQYLFQLTREFQGISLLSNVWALADTTAGPSDAVHYVAGFETRLGRFDLDLEGYYKGYAGLYEIDYNEQASTRIGDLILRGPGRAFGLDLLIRKRAGRQTGWLSASLGASERTIDGVNVGADGRPRVFRSKFDRTLILDLVHSLRFGRARRWTLNTRAAYATGQPYTQVLGRGELTVPSGFRWTFEEKGELNGVRLPSYQRLDVSAQRRFALRTWTLSAYLQVTNLTNRRNVFNYFWSQGAAHKRQPGSRQEIPMLPILPSLGLDFEF